MKKSLLERLIDTNKEAEIWWDSSPLVYENWASGLIEGAVGERKTFLEKTLKNYFDPSNPSQTFFRGVTTNPPLSLNVFKDDPTSWQGAIQALIEREPHSGVEDIFWLTYKEIVKKGAKAYMPLFESSNKTYGFISAQVDPRDLFQKEKMLKQAFDLAEISPNIMIKVPGSKEGYEVIRELTARGIATNNTLSMTVPQFMACIESVEKGLEEAKEKGVSLSAWRSVITHMSARYGSLGDLTSQAKARGIELTEEDIRYAELAIFKRAYKIIEEKGHPTKMLMCSMRMGPPSDDGSATSWHIEKVAGGDIVYTCPPGYIANLLEVEESMKPFDAQAIYEPVPEDVLTKLMEIPYFVRAYEVNGMKREEFNTMGALVSTAAEFSKATREMVDFVTREFQRVKPLKDFYQGISSSFFD